MSTLTSEAVGKIIQDCLLKTEETAPYMEVRCIVNTFRFHPGRLESHRDEVAQLLAELPDEFHEGKGGGWTFLNACMTKDGEQWGEHINMEQLFALGVGLGLVRWQFPREMWFRLPGGMPYVVVLQPKPRTNQPTNEQKDHRQD